MHERAWIVVIAGEVEITTPGTDDRVAGGPGALFEFDPGERREVSARTDARLLLLLAPWPGVGHPGAMSMEEKGEARARAAQLAEG